MPIMEIHSRFGMFLRSADTDFRRKRLKAPPAERAAPLAPLPDFDESGMSIPVTTAFYTALISFSFSCLRCTMCFSFDVYCFPFFFPEVLFHSKVIEACPVTTDRIFGDDLM